MELVHDMLRVAMASDGEKDDPVKEEAEKKMEETIANLKVKLNDARIEEGMEPLGPGPLKDQNDPVTIANGAVELQEELDASREKVCPATLLSQTTC